MKTSFYQLFYLYIKHQTYLILDNTMGNSQPQPSHEPHHQPQPRHKPQHKAASSRAPPSHHHHHEETILPIPPRLQWENDNGYCGQTSIQSISLYYGSYISQIKAREAAGSEVLIGENAEPAIDKISYEYETWDSESHQPQYKDYLQWIKTNIIEGYPVIVGGYDPEGNKQEVYNHIYLVIGVKSNNVDHYCDDDVLVYSTLFQPNHTHTPFGKVWDSRQMENNGKHLQFAIPRDVNYGVAVKGIKNSSGIFHPLRITLDENKQPNVSIGEEAVQFTLHITASALTPGKNYAILRYDSYQNIPGDQVKASEASNIVKFEAEGESYSFDDTVESSGMAFYRCVSEDNLQ